MLLTVTLLMVGGSFFSQSSFADTRENEARKTLESFVSDHLSLFTIPKSQSKPIFYTLCNSYGAQYAVGYEGGKCVALSINAQGKIEYVPMKIRAIKIGAAAAVTAHLTALHRIKGVKDFSEITGAYLFLNSGVSAIGSFQENYFTKKIAWNGIGNTPECDASWGGAEMNFLSLGVLWYTKHDYSRTQTLQLDQEQINFIKK